MRRLTLVRRSFINMPLGSDHIGWSPAAVRATARRTRAWTWARPAATRLLGTLGTILLLVCIQACNGREPGPSQSQGNTSPGSGVPISPAVNPVGHWLGPMPGDTVRFSDPNSMQMNDGTNSFIYHRQ